MNYQRIHDSIIAKAKSENRSKSTGVYERHHIIPTAVGGPDTDENTVLLTLREHYIVHLLLWKLNPGIKKFRDPIFTFRNKGAKDSRVYEAVRQEHIIEMKENNPSLHLSDAAKKSKKEKLSNYASNRTPEHQAKLNASMKGLKRREGAILSEDTKDQISKSLKKYYKENEVSEETREKLRASNLGKKHTDESIKRMKQSALQRPRWPHPKTAKLYDGGNLTQVLRREGWDDEKILEYKNTVEPTIIT